MFQIPLTLRHKISGLTSISSVNDISSLIFNSTLYVLLQSQKYIELVSISLVSEKESLQMKCIFPISSSLSIHKNIIYVISISESYLYIFTKISEESNLVLFQKIKIPGFKNPVILKGGRNNSPKNEKLSIFVFTSNQIHSFCTELLDMENEKRNLKIEKIKFCKIPITPYFTKIKNISLSVFNNQEIITYNTSSYVSVYFTNGNPLIKKCKLPPFKDIFLYDSQMYIFNNQNEISVCQIHVNSFILKYKIETKLDFDIKWLYLQHERDENEYFCCEKINSQIRKSNTVPLILSGKMNNKYVLYVDGYLFETNSLVKTFQTYHNTFLGMSNDILFYLPDDSNFDLKFTSDEKNVFLAVLKKINESKNRSVIFDGEEDEKLFYKTTNVCGDKEGDFICTVSSLSDTNLKNNNFLEKLIENPLNCYLRTFKVEPSCGKSKIGIFFAGIVFNGFKIQIKKEICNILYFLINSAKNGDFSKKDSFEDEFCTFLCESFICDKSIEISETKNDSFSLESLLDKLLVLNQLLQFEYKCADVFKDYSYNFCSLYSSVSSLFDSNFFNANLILKILKVNFKEINFHWKEEEKNLYLYLHGMNNFYNDLNYFNIFIKIDELYVNNVCLFFCRNFLIKEILQYLNEIEEKENFIIKSIWEEIFMVLCGFKNKNGIKNLFLENENLQCAGCTKNDFKPLIQYDFKTQEHEYETDIISIFEYLKENYEYFGILKESKTNCYLPSTSFDIKIFEKFLIKSWIKSGKSLQLIDLFMKSLNNKFDLLCNLEYKILLKILNFIENEISMTKESLNNIIPFLKNISTNQNINSPEYDYFMSRVKRVYGKVIYIISEMVQDNSKKELSAQIIDSDVFYYKEFKSSDDIYNELPIVKSDIISNLENNYYSFKNNENKAVWTDVSELCNNDFFKKYQNEYFKKLEEFLNK
ncbi:hypothetical protein CWI36_0157p0020 [Hamiltosporidium magnivora]|uniref:Uncharacterized protein n=3 Tax=Hamiltosporidium magnivora TaxID=148818 RepID=A0A4V2JWK9_9MICR|nr:hypothetical protein CWI36_0157p0020 [Hamiltosporidium magnivora]